MNFLEGKKGEELKRGVLGGTLSGDLFMRPGLKSIEHCR